MQPLPATIRLATPSQLAEEADTRAENGHAEGNAAEGQGCRADGQGNTENIDHESGKVCHLGIHLLSGGFSKPRARL